MFLSFQLFDFVLLLLHSPPVTPVTHITPTPDPLRTTYKVGVVLISDHGAPYDVERSGAAVRLAFDMVNEQVLNGTAVQLEPVTRSYGPACDAATAPGE